MLIEVESNPNCEQAVFARFREIGPVRVVLQVKSYERNALGEWCWVTGWCDDSKRPLCPALDQVVEDSGAGLTHLVHGGIWGIRLKPVSVSEDWDVKSAHQWGEPYLSLADPNDIKYQSE
ncbi:MAG: hypothetical protein ACREJU_14520 [Nitrospiraceae bacterium]